MSHKPLRAVPDQDRPVVATPSDPLTNARHFLSDAYVDPDGNPLLRHHQGDWYRWDGSRWVNTEVEVIDNELYEWFHPTSYWKVTKNDRELVHFNPDKSKIDKLQHALRAQVHVTQDVSPPAWITGDQPSTHIIACRNGLLDMRTRRLRKHSPLFFNMTVLPFDWDPDAPRPVRWLTFLRTIWPDDDEAISALQEVFGYLVSSDTSQQKIIGLIGPKRCGKGTIGRVLTALLGQDDVTGPTLASLATNFGLQSLIGRRLAIIGDARLRGTQNVVAERLLSISGEDMLAIDRKNQVAWVGRLPTRIVMLSNEVPSIMDASGALPSRFMLFRLVRSWYGNEDLDLEKQLHAELPGILAWALDGLARLLERGHLTTPASSAELVSEMEDLSSPVAAFIRDRCVISDSATVPADDLFRAWKDWCNEQGRDHVGTVQTFGRDLRAVVPEVSTSRPAAHMGPRRRHYDGIGLGTPRQEPL